MAKPGTWTLVWPLIWCRGTSSCHHLVLFSQVRGRSWIRGEQPGLGAALLWDACAADGSATHWLTALSLITQGVRDPIQYPPSSPRVNVPIKIEALSHLYFLKPSDSDSIDRWYVAGLGV